MKKSVVITAMLALATIPALAGSLQVEVIDGRDHMVAFEISDDMMVCGDNQINSQVTAVAWQVEGDATILPGKDGYSQAFDMNSFGDVVGWFDSAANGESTGVVWYADTGYQTWTEIGKPAGTYLYTQAFTINDHGVVGVMAGRNSRNGQDDDPSGLAQDPFLWSESRGFTALETLHADADAQIFDINNAGTVVGMAEGAATYAVTWSRNGKINVLGIPEGERSAIARGINEAGTIVGHDNSFNSDAWVYTKKDGFVMLEDFGFAGKAFDINNHGIIVGTADVFPFEPAPVVWDAEGNIYNLKDAMAGMPYYMTDGVAINDNNQIVAYGINRATGRRQALVLQLTFVD